MARIHRIEQLSRRFTLRLVVGVLAVHALLLPLFFIGVIYIVKIGYETQFIDRVRGDTQTFSQHTEQYLASGEFGAQFEQHMLAGALLFSELVSPQGKRLAITQKPGHRADFKEDFFFDQHGDGVYYVALPVYRRDGRLLGTLRLGYDETQTREDIHLTYRRGAYVAFAYILLTLVLVAFGDRILGFMRREMVAQAQQLEYQSLHDTLTGLPNRVMLEETLQQRLGTLYALIFIDLDRFKDINDALGHGTGDLILQRVAARFQSLVTREGDLLVRLGGDEFAILLADAKIGEATGMVEGVLSALAQAFDVDGRSLHIGARLGVALCPEDGHEPQTLMRRAEVAMYAAKHGGARYVLYHPVLDQDKLEQLETSEALHEGIGRGELVVHYQPQIDLRSRSIWGVEALVRWQHPERGLLPPDEFIHIAENTGLIGVLTEAVVRQVIADQAALKAISPDIRVSVNLSPKNLQDQRLVEWLTGVLGHLKEATPYMVLELTESAIFADPAGARQMLSGLQSMGVSLSIDDFGTGYSSLSNLRKLPVSEIKIDKSFVTGMVQNQDDTAIVRAIIDLAHDLGLSVVAEGVEDASVLEILTGFGCDIAQGYYVSRPMAVADLLQWMTHSPWAQPATALPKYYQL